MICDDTFFNYNTAKYDIITSENDNFTTKSISPIRMDNALF